MRANCGCSGRWLFSGSRVLLGLATLFVATASAATFSVNSVGDTDDGACSAAHCTLREAILVANASPGTDEIVFDIPGTGPHTIQPGSRLPTIVDPIVIDGYTQPGARANTNPPELGSNAVIQVEVNGDLAGCASGFWIETGNSVVRGLAVTGFSIVGRECGAGFLVRGSGNNSIEGNFIGIDPSGSLERPNHMGLTLVSPTNTVGGAEPGARNVISGNNEYGIWLANANESRVIGNLIGTDASGEVAVPNTVGILVRLAHGNVFGGMTPSERNVISGNRGNGLVILDRDSTENYILGNYFGTNVSGTGALGNGTQGFGNGSGIAIDGRGNVVGGETKDAGNLIAYNPCSAMYINGVDNAVLNNRTNNPFVIPSNRFNDILIRESGDSGLRQTTGHAIVCRVILCDSSLGFGQGGHRLGHLGTDYIILIRR